MEAKVFTQDGIDVIEISGRLEMDKAAPLKEACLAQCRKRLSVFSLNRLKFVGSSGIKVFFQTFKELKADNVPFKIVGIKADFQRFSLLMDHSIFEVFPSVDMAIYSLKNPDIQMNFQEDPGTYSLHPIVMPVVENSEGYPLGNMNFAEDAGECEAIGESAAVDSDVDLNSVG